MTLHLEPKKIQLKDVDLAYIEHGLGDPVVFVHGGFLSDLRTWALQMEAFSKRYHAVAYSLRYHYPNAWTGDGSDYRDTVHAEDLAGLINGLGLSPAHVVGTSYGSRVALLLAYEHPELVDTLVLGEPLLFSWLQTPPEEISAFDDFMTNCWGPATKAAQSGKLEEAVRTFINWIIGKGAYDKLPDEFRRRMMENARLLTVPYPSLTLTREQAKTIQHPTLLLTGEGSRKNFLLATDELARLLRNVERGKIPAASHVLHSLNPNAYNETVLEFLSRH